MVVVENFCIDRYEAYIEGHSPYEVPTEGKAANAQGEIPQGYISGEISQKVCETAGKRLCTLNEWMRSCQGPDGYTYPYGNTYDPEACNVSRPVHPINSYWGNDPNRWDYTHMNDPGINQQADTVDSSGSNKKCVTVEGVYDMHGNLHEWISDPAGTFKGGFYADASINGQGCYYTTTAHSYSYHDYSTGFRCCADQTATE
jgi:formylglycine-generating enzyme required for sulfatase activity